MLLVDWRHRMLDIRQRPDGLLDVLADHERGAVLVKPERSGLTRVRGYNQPVRDDVDGCFKEARKLRLKYSFAIALRSSIWPPRPCVCQQSPEPRRHQIPPLLLAWHATF